jgi:cytochrome b6-f complex iron-sulfur subunit
MADKLADLSPEEKEKRIAEMKAKMQAAAAKNKPAGEAAGEAKAAPAKAAKPPSVSSGEAAIAQAQATAAAAHAVPAEASAAVIEESTRNAGSDHPAPVAPAAEVAAASGVGAAVVKTNGASGTNGANGANGAGVAAAPVLVAAPPVFVEETPEQKAKKEMNRREFLTYAWGATLGLLALQAGVGTFFFMYPRFKAGEFGGKFTVGPVDALPPTDAAPIAETAGKFWLVNTAEEGPKALYMVCTHLGCLYKWAQSNNRFECPCHGSKFSREGFYIEGPASRSLDMFEITEEEGMVVVNTGKRILGAPAAESPDRVVPA